jgi:hypothetical protein
MEMLWLPLARKLEPKMLYLCGGWADELVAVAEDELPKTEIVYHCHPASRGGLWENQTRW